MYRLAKRELQVSCPRKRWILAIGSHHNILIFYNRYPLEGALDLGDVSSKDFESLSHLFATKEGKFLTGNKKWYFELDARRNLFINYNHHPFMGRVEFIELSPEHCIELSNMFLQASKL